MILSKSFWEIIFLFSRKGYGIVSSSGYHPLAVMLPNSLNLAVVIPNSSVFGTPYAI